MLSFKNFSIAGITLEVPPLLKLLRSRIDALGILYTVKNDVFGFVFNPTEKGKMFTSKEANMLVMKKTDPRIAKLGREILESHRITQDQYDGLMKLVHSYFSSMGIDVLIEHTLDNDVVKVIVNGKTVVGSIPTPINPPIKKLVADVKTTTKGIPF